MKGNHNQQKRHGRSLHARLFSLLLAVVTAVTMIPSTAFAAPEEGVENGVTGGAEDGAATSALSAGEPVIRIAWTPQAESAAAGEQVAVLLEASAENLPGADVSIELTDAEAGALKAWMETEAAEGITLTENEQSGADENDPARDGEFSLQFSLNEEQPSLEKELALSVPEDITEPFTFEIGEEDITVMTEEPAGVEPKVELTASPLKFTAAAQDGSASQTEEDGPEKAEPETAEPENGQEAKAVKSASLTKTVYWVDNNDEAETREAAKEALVENVKIFFSEEGGAYTQLTAENCGKFGLKELPEIGITDDATHSYIAADVPDAEGVTWKLETDPAAAEGYVFFDVREDNIGDYPALNEDTGKCGWYFVLTTDFTITVEMKDGEKSSNTAVFAEAVNNQFHLQGDAKTGKIDIAFKDVDWKKPDVTSGISSAEMSCTVRKFNLDGFRRKSLE